MIDIRELCIQAILDSVREHGRAKTALEGAEMATDIVLEIVERYAN